MCVRTDRPAVPDRRGRAQRDVDPGGTQTGFFDGEVQEVVAVDAVDGQGVGFGGVPVVVVCD